MHRRPLHLVHIFLTVDGRALTEAFLEEEEEVTRDGQTETIDGGFRSTHDRELIVFLDSRHKRELLALDCVHLRLQLSPDSYSCS